MPTTGEKSQHSAYSVGSGSLIVLLEEYTGTPIYVWGRGIAALFVVARNYPKTWDAAIWDVLIPSILQKHPRRNEISNE